MIKFREISNFANVKTFPNIRAHEDMPNYRAVAVDQIGRVTSYATATTPKHNLCVVMNEFWNRTGDLYFGDRTLRAGQTVLCVGLESIATRFLDVGASHIADAIDSTGALTVSPGDALVPDGTGNWAVAASVPTEGIYLLVTGVTTLPTYGSGGSDGMTEPAVIAQIISV